MHIDERLCCAAGICCRSGGGAAMRAAAAILRDLGCPAEHASNMARKMNEAGIVFLSAPLAAAIGEIVDHPRKAEEEAPG